MIIGRHWGQKRFTNQLDSLVLLYHRHRIAFGTRDMGVNGRWKRPARQTTNTVGQAHNQADLGQTPSPVPSSSVYDPIVGRKRAALVPSAHRG